MGGTNENVNVAFPSECGNSRIPKTDILTIRILAS